MDIKKFIVVYKDSCQTNIHYIEAESIEKVKHYCRDVDVLEIHDINELNTSQHLYAF